MAANRANAARSTGPRTAEGKDRAKMNAVRHGLAAHAAVLHGEDPAELDALARAYAIDLRPRGALERDLVARIVGLSWRLRRVARAEQGLWERDEKDFADRVMIGTYSRVLGGTERMPWEPDPDAPPRSGTAFVAGQFSRESDSPLERLAVYEQRLERALHAAIRELKSLRELRGAGFDYAEEEEASDATAPGDAGGGGIAEVPAAEPAPVAERVAKPQAAEVAGESTRAPGGDAAEGPRLPVESTSASPSEGAEGQVAQNEPTAVATGAAEPRSSQPVRGDAPPDGTIRHIVQNEPTERPLWTRTPTGFSPA